MSILASIFNSGLGAFLGIIVFAMAGIAYGLILGKNRLINVFLSSCLAFLMVFLLPWANLGFLGLEREPDVKIRILVFLGLILALIFLLPNSLLARALKTAHHKKGSFSQRIILGILELGFLIAALVSFLDAKAIAKVSFWAQKLFTGDLNLFIWFSLILLGLLLWPRSKRKKGSGEDD